MPHVLSIRNMTFCNTLGTPTTASLFVAAEAFGHDIVKEQDHQVQCSRSTCKQWRIVRRGMFLTFQQKETK